MTCFLVHLMGQREPVKLDLPFSDIEGVMAEASRAKFLVGYITTSDEDGVCRRMMISTYRIECVVEVNERT